MTENKYILSICIPTRNRADVLVHTLDSIVNNPYFSDEIEVVVSDNASTDGTQQLMLDYSVRYSNIKYYRQKENIGVYGNIISVLDNASGQFLKLSNDYNVFTQNGVKHLVDIVKKFEESRQLIIVGNSSNDYIEISEKYDINGIIKKIGWGFSYMGNYGFWKEDWTQIDDKFARVDTMFILDGHFFQILEKKGSVCICSAHIFDRYPFKQKQGGYNFFKVHTVNYLALFDEFYKDGKISKETYDKLHRMLLSGLLPFLTKFLFTEKDNYSYELKGWWHYFIKVFGRYPWFYKKMAKWIWENRINLLKR